MSEINNNKGSIQISDDVIATIAHTAMLEVEGTYDYSTLAGDIIEKFFKKNFKGISLSIENKNISISMNLVVKLNYKINDVAKKVQDKVKNAIEMMTGFNVICVNINVIGVDISKLKKKENTETVEE